jgi:hypothetical protein
MSIRMDDVVSEDEGASYGARSKKLGDSRYLDCGSRRHHDDERQEKLMTAEEEVRERFHRRPLDRFHKQENLRQELEYWDMRGRQDKLELEKLVQMPDSVLAKLFEVQRRLQPGPAIDGQQSPHARQARVVNPPPADDHAAMVSVGRVVDDLEKRCEDELRFIHQQLLSTKAQINRSATQGCGERRPQ